MLRKLAQTKSIPTLSRFAGGGTAAAAHLPLANLLVPAFTALVFVHLGLAALRRQRQEGGIEL